MASYRFSREVPLHMSSRRVWWSYVIAVTSLMASAACHSTHLVASWRDPSAPPLHFRKAIAVFVTKDEALRRTLEDKMADELPNTVPSYRVLRSSDIADTAGIVRRLRKEGFDGAIIMRVARCVLVRSAVLLVQQLLGNGLGLPLRSRVCVRQPDRDDRDSDLLADKRKADLGRSQRDNRSANGWQAGALRGRPRGSCTQERRPARADDVLRDTSVRCSSISTLA